MYFIFKDSVLDSGEIAQRIQNDTKIRIESDLTKSTKREDMCAFLARIPENELLGEIVSEADDEQKFDQLMKSADEYSAAALKPIFEDFVLELFSFRYDQVQKDVQIVIVAGHKDVGSKKVFDVLNRILKQV